MWWWSTWISWDISWCIRLDQHDHRFRKLKLAGIKRIYKAGRWQAPWSSLQAFIKKNYKGTRVITNISLGRHHKSSNYMVLVTKLHTDSGQLPIWKRQGSQYTKEQKEFLPFLLELLLAPGDGSLNCHGLLNRKQRIDTKKSMPAHFWQEGSTIMSWAGECKPHCAPLGGFTASQGSEHGVLLLISSLD